MDLWVWVLIAVVAAPLAPAVIVVRPSVPFFSAVCVLIAALWGARCAKQ